jgi:20S proteasome subunit alpha 6
MAKNLYDSDVTTWSSNGKLFQVDYAGEAVKQGSATAGCKSDKHAVIVALKRSQAATLSSYQEKLFVIDGHLGMSVSGLVADARYLARFLRGECMNWRYMYDSFQPVARISDAIGRQYHSHTQRGDKRPYGVGLLIAGYDERGPHLLQTHPSGEVWSFKATAIGSRSQSARTYLEKHFESFPGCTLEQLVLHALKALANTTSEDVKLTAQNTSIGIVGENQLFEILSEEKAQVYLDRLQLQPGDIVRGADADAGSPDDIPVDTTM